VQTRARRSAALGAVVTLLLTSGCTSWRSKEKPIVRPATAELTPGASNHVLEDVTIAVAENTVNVPTELYVFKPEPKPDEPSLPFGGNGLPNVQFDISLARGAQPLQPLDVKIPLSGKFLPPGANPEHALLYSPNKAGEWRLVPGIVENGVLHAQVASLSPKHIVFFDPVANFLQTIGKWEAEGVKDCNREITTAATGKIKLGGSGWKNANDSPLHPCLVEENGKAQLRVGNNSTIMWSVASNGPSVNAPRGGTEDELIKLIVKTFNSDKRVKAYLAEGDATWTEIDNNSLPVTLEFRANPDTFLARAFWVGLNMSVGMLTGTSGDKTAEVIKTLLVDGSDLVGCLEDVAQSANNIFDANKIVDTLLSICGEKIAQGLGVDVASKGAVEWTFGGILAALGGIKDSAGLLFTAYQSVMQQLGNGVTVKVERAAPPKPSCASRSDFNAASSRARGNRVTAQVVNIKCVEGWASGSEVAGAGFDGVLVVVQLKNGRWEEVFVGSAPPEHGFDAFCDDNRTPRKIRELCVG
jgi:hypothetical protein